MNLQSLNRSVHTHASECRSQLERLVCQMLGIAAEDKESLQSALRHLSASAIVSQMKHKTASHTIEATFLNCPSSMFSAVWRCLEPTFASLCLNPISNFAAQSIIAAAPAASHINEIFRQVRGSLTDIITRGRSGVACVLTAACAAWGVECEACCEAIEAAFPEGVCCNAPPLCACMSAWPLDTIPCHKSS